MRLVFKGFEHTSSYASHHVRRVYAGDEFEVPDAIGQKILEDFGSAFELLKPSLKKPIKAAVISSGDGVDTAVLDGTVSSLRTALESGDYDPVLLLLREAEMNGKTRKSAINALEERIAEVSA